VPEHLIDVIAPDVGGGFGQKGNLFSEEILVCLLARELGVPVRWIEDRYENLAARTHAKPQIAELEFELDGDGHLLDVNGAIDVFPYEAHNALISEGSYVASIDALEGALDYGAFLARQQSLRRESRYVGLGISVFNELTGGSTKSTYVTGFDSTTHDTATVRMDPSGKVTLTTSLPSQGQGHATVFA